jgi:hypothetical protein
VVKFTYLGDNALKGRNFLITGDTAMVCTSPAPESEPEPEPEPEPELSGV